MKVSVVMGVHDAGPLLRETIDSILAQTFRDFELIVVDDGSREPVVIADPHVRVIRIDTNGGLTRALIAGCAAARGELIARHDAGDLSHPDRLELQVAQLDANQELAFVSSFTEYIGPDRESLFVQRGTGRALQPVAIVDPEAEHGAVDGPTSHGSVMFRREAYLRAGGYRAAFYYGQDWDLWYRLGLEGTFQIVPHTLYRQRVTPGSISSIARAAQLELASLSLAAMRARSRGEPEAPILEQAATILRPTGRSNPAPGLYFIAEALRRNGDRRARKYFRAAITASPLFVRAWVRLLQSVILR